MNNNYPFRRFIIPGQISYYHSVLRLHSTIAFRDGAITCHKTHPWTHSESRRPTDIIIPKCISPDIFTLNLVFVQTGFIVFRHAFCWRCLSTCGGCAVALLHAITGDETVRTAPFWEAKPIFNPTIESLRNIAFPKTFVAIDGFTGGRFRFRSCLSSCCSSCCCGGWCYTCTWPHEKPMFFQTSGPALISLSRNAETCFSISERKWVVVNLGHCSGRNLIFGETWKVLGLPMTSACFWECLEREM